MRWSSLDYDDGNAEAKSLTVVAYRKLHDAIVRGSLRPGERLGMADLQQRFELGVAAIREALSRLSSEGLVIAREQRGFIVAPLRKEEVTDVLETRLLIEGEALRRSIENGDVVWEGELLAVFHRLKSIPFPHVVEEDVDNWRRCHCSFHMTLLSRCNSPLLMRLSKNLFDQSERTRFLRMANISAANVALVQSEHKQILEATLDRDVIGATKNLEQHYRRTAVEALEGLSAWEAANPSSPEPEPKERSRARGKNAIQK